MNIINVKMIYNIFFKMKKKCKDNIKYCKVDSKILYFRYMYM